MQKISPFLWFNDNAEKAVTFYTSVFKNSRVKSKSFYEEGGMGPAGSLMTASFELEGQEFIALNGGPHFKFTEAISFVINCSNQEEVDYYWDRLSEGGEQSRCGWLKDPFGLSWQVVPVQLEKWMADKDSVKAKRVTEAMLQMNKIIIADLEKAYQGK